MPQLPPAFASTRFTTQTLSSAPFSPVAGYHFPFQSLAGRTHPHFHSRHSSRHSPVPSGMMGEKEDEVKGDEGDGGAEAQGGLLCLESAVEVGLLPAGSHRTVPLQWLALREGLLPLHRLVLHVAETDSMYCTVNSGEVLVDSSIAV